ncbi:hypothetical protein Z517_02830 [Fonsecaea pedrosoi CBS 271.37]|uniref:Origin recognition complex subunit 3 n=1 Tax=Fonsecaea pedrosoi CBS 271.37 TaxID=1442368 RepID=A0A0D2GY89_9EURO|nr:uncharacterized protein Z517_02830 [Fonsecaea pedrosoi CBS 271.37]KIW83585.1 hypothetical protein Z517_02830 [Fonsecaea pedrosoi CBS 271.37]
MDDVSHTTCYIFKPTNQDTQEIDPRPQKRRKLSKVPPKDAQEEYSWPRVLGGQESPDDAGLRRSQFETVWAEQQKKIQRIVDVVDEGFVGPVMRFAHSQNADNLRTHKRLKTALLALGPNTNHHHDLHERWKSTMRGDTSREPEVLVTLQPAHCPNIQTALKNVVRSAISGHQGAEKYTEFLNEHKLLIPMNFDLELLQRYVLRYHIERVVISIMDVEGFDTSIFAELVSTFHSWSDRIPIILFVGISTTVELFESRLSRQTVSMLDAEIFATSPDFNLEDRLFDLYEAIQHDQTAEVFLGPSVVNELATLAEDQGTTPATFARAIKYAHMSHFFANPLSRLSTEATTKSPWSPVLCQAIRNLASFRSHCEALAKGNKTERETVRRLLVSDDELQRVVVEAIESGKRIMRSGLSAVSTLRYIYHCTLKLESYSRWESETHLLQSLPDLTQSEIFEAIEDDLQNLSSEVSATQLLKGSVPELRDLHDYQRSCVEPEAETGTDASPSEAEKFISLLRRYLESRTSSSSPEHHLISPFRHFMAEAYTMAQKSPLAQTMHPRPRYCLERALTRPADYLGCSCCTPRGSGEAHAATRGDVPDKANLPPTSLLLNMLNEAGTVVNVRDLWDAFRDTLSHGTESASPDADRDGLDDDNDDNDDDEVGGDDKSNDERRTLALFYRALADLRYLGLIRQSKRKPGVECIAKTAWMGL